jgi:methionyl-tRNA formyltransferase
VARIVAFSNGSPHSWIVLNAIVAAHGPLTVLIEPPESKSVLLRRRMKKQGVVTVAGQVGFVLLQKLLSNRSKARIKDIVVDTKSQTAPASECEVRQIPSVNSLEARAILNAIKPDVVVVFGTRMIGRETLAAILVPLINFHSGINPKYRGQAGGYWAMACGDVEHAGVTAHLVDAGVDTGDVLYHGKIAPTARDDFNTYYYLQAAAMRPLAVKAVADALAGMLRPFKPDLPSQQFYHPTLWFYLWTGFTKGAW